MPLPEGFAIDKPEAEISQSVGRVPQGFVIDKKPKVLSLPEAPNLNILPRQSAISEAIPQQSAISEAVSNVPKSGMEALKNIYQAFRHPVKTATEVARLGAGAVEKGVSQVFPGFEGASEERFNAFADAMKERLGGLDKIEETFRKDPVGLFFDATTVLGGVGGAVSKAGQLTKLPALAKTGKLISKASTPVRSIIESKATINSLVKTALQLPKKTKLQRIDELANAFLKNGLNINRKSVAKLDVKINKAKKAINSIVDKKTTEGILIKTDDIINSLEDLIKEFDANSLELPDVKVIKKMKTDFITLRDNKTLLTPKEVQAVKVSYNKAFEGEIGTRFGAARKKARDAVRDAAKTQLEKLHPELKKLNANEGVSIELKGAIEDAIKTFEKRPTVAVKGLFAGGIAGGLGIGFGGLIPGIQFGVAAVIAEKIISNPKIQVVLAKALRKARFVSERTGGFARIPFQAGRAKEIAEEAESSKKINVTGIRQKTGKKYTMQVSPERAQSLINSEKKKQETLKSFLEELK